MILIIEFSGFFPHSLTVVPKNLSKNMENLYVHLYVFSYHM